MSSDTIKSPYDRFKSTIGRSPIIDHAQRKTLIKYWVNSNGIFVDIWKQKSVLFRSFYKALGYKAVFCTEGEVNKLTFET